MDIFISIIECISGIIFLIIIYIIFKRIKQDKIKKIYKFTFFVLLLVSAFIFSIHGWKGNIFFWYFVIELFLGIIIFFYSIIYIIKCKKFNYLLLTPFLLIIFCLSGIYYGERHYRKIAIIADNIIAYYNENNLVNSELFNKLKVPKNMEIFFIENSYKGNINELLNYLKVSQDIEKYIENDEIVIFYKDLIYLVRKGRYIDNKK
jgi:hypothetical protein